jgi:hypothetical protein
MPFVAPALRRMSKSFLLLFFKKGSIPSLPPSLPCPPDGGSE